MVPPSTGGTTNTDQPYIASNPNSPYSTWVAWASSGGNFINNIKYTPVADGGADFEAGVPQPLFNNPLTLALRPKIAMGSIKLCSGSVDEAVFVAFMDNPNIRDQCSSPRAAELYGVNWSWGDR